MELDDKNQNANAGGNVISPNGSSTNVPQISKATAAMTSSSSPVKGPAVPPLTQSMVPDESMPKPMPASGTENVSMDKAYVVPPLPPTVKADVPEVRPTASSIINEPIEDLIEIKKEALEKLAPLVDKLDQTPEEKFRTLMMLIQVSDNQHFVKPAFEAAGKIPDENVRAQALLDIVNEINYFTQKPDKPDK